ncbi:hypothetical protein EXW72_15240 [Pseudomonas sp. BCA14]|nr:hypothetical protein EXW70_15960 [Pseudomonas sp. JMN1]TFF10891.1 hypothetical protein EXW71_14040 [Pseudomonas sp. BCA17]TFF22502.1 hypothetical protein EXW73_19520 [Pseudomonas sp. BCA13]TFF26438.1 hypothetical protein EXW72_15240 [Pseudomonas sp. BCA14]
MLALGCEAAPIQPTCFFRWSALPGFGAASRTSASKLARHKRQTLLAQIVQDHAGNQYKRAVLELFASRVRSCNRSLKLPGYVL